MPNDIKVENRRGANANHLRPVGRPPFECIALLLQGGGALGSYQAGVYEALAEANLHPDWVAGISIGAINSAIIAGIHRRNASESCARSGKRSRSTRYSIGRSRLSSSRSREISRAGHSTR